jgi:hypothetical protein
MSSPGTASDISPQEAADLLHKLITESTKLQVTFRGSNGVSAGLVGVIGMGAPDLVVAKPDTAPDDAPFVSFKPGLATVFKYAAGLAIPDLPNSPRFSSALALIYPDDSQIALMEFA